MTIKQDLKVERYKLVAECVPDPVLYFNYASRDPYSKLVRDPGQGPG